MKRLALVLAGTMLVSACSDSGPTTPVEIPFELGDVQLGLVDGANGSGGNPKFFFLRPLTETRGLQDEPNEALDPVVEVCLRNQAGDGCDPNQPPLASFFRDGPTRERIRVDSRGHYNVAWRMKDYPPQQNGIYRVRVLLHGSELGHADVITLRQRDIKAFSSVGDEIVPISDKGNFDISFFLVDGVLEDQFCDFDGDGDVEDCDAGVEDPTDGQPTVLTVVDGNEIVAVLTAPDGVFLDAQGNPIPDVVFTAEVEIAPPSKDLILDDTKEHPFFVEVNTFPNDVYMDPAGPGISVVICQDDAVLQSRGITDPLHPQLVLYKVSDPKAGFPNGETKRLSTTFGAPVCGTPAPAPRVRGITGVVRTAAASVARLFQPEPLRARRLHGGLNTVIVRDISSSDAAFSTFGTTLGPNAAQTTAIVPDGNVNVVTSILIEVRTALGDVLQFGGDAVSVTVSSGPNVGAPVSVTDNGNGTYSASYTPLLSGVDELSVSLTTADGWAQGAIGGSPFSSTVHGPMVVGTFANPRGLVGLVASWDPAGGPLSISGPGGLAYTCPISQPPGIATDRAFCLADTPPAPGTYLLSSTLGSSSVTPDTGASLTPPVVQAVSVSGTDVTITWTGDASQHGSYFVFLFRNGIVSQHIVSASTLSGGLASVTIDGSSLGAGLAYFANVAALSEDLTTSFPLVNQLNGRSGASFSFVNTPSEQ